LDDRGLLHRTFSGVARQFVGKAFYFEHCGFKPQLGSQPSYLFKGMLEPFLS
jgi:hypothetical protein